MKRFFTLSVLMAALAMLAGCSSTSRPVVVEFRGNPISGNLPSLLKASGGPYLATDTLRVPAGQTVTIEPGTELRFDSGVPFEVYGALIAHGNDVAPITFTSGQKYPSRGDWDGIWVQGGGNSSSFEYCRFLFGSKYGRHYHHLTTISHDSLIVSPNDSAVSDYGCLTLINSSPSVDHCWFLESGFHGVHCDSLSAPTIKNCVFRDNAGHGIFVRYDSNPTIKYNIIVENDDYGVFCSENGEAARADLNLTYNIVWSNFSGEFNALAPISLGRIAATNGNLDSCDSHYNLRVNPNFADAANWDFHLTPCSGAIDAGPAGVDLDGDGTRLEMGVFHYNYRPGEIRRLITVDNLELSKSPYYMSCDVLLPAGQTLGIEAGVEVRVEGLYTFRVLGHILSSGTAANPVVFHSAAAQPVKGDWVGLVIPTNADQGTIFTYTTIKEARWGIHLIGHDATIDHCIISNSDSVGIYCENNSSPTIHDCQFSNNSIAGILCQFNSSPDILRCRIEGGAGYGIFAIESSRPMVRNCIITGVATDGIRLENLSDATIVNNDIAKNGYYGLYCFNNSSPSVRDNIFYRNGSDERGGVGIFAQRSSLPQIFYNCFWGHPVTPVSVSSDTTAFDHNSSIFSDPMFVNEAAGDYHLQAGSPCRGHGDGGGDIGAYGGPEAGE